MRRAVLCVFILFWMVPATSHAQRSLRVRIELGEKNAVELRAELTDLKELVLEGELNTRWTGKRSADLTIDFASLTEVPARRTVSLPPPPPGPQEPLPPGVLAGLRLPEADRGVLSTWSGPLVYTLSFEARHGRVDPRWASLADPRAFQAEVVRSWALLGEFLRARGIPTHGQRDIHSTVHFFAVWRETLEDPDRVRPVMIRLNQPGGVLWGLYTPWATPAGDSTIVVTPVGGQTTRSVLAHELAHLAWDRFGVGPHWSGDTEDFARAFERWAFRGRDSTRGWRSGQEPISALRWRGRN